MTGERKHKTTVLLIDPDLAFSFWLGQALDSAGHNALPLRTTSAAYELIRNHRLFIDAVVINPVVPNVLLFLPDLRKFFPSVSVIVAIPEDGDRGFALPQCEIAATKPAYLTREASAQWVNLIQSVAASRGLCAAQN